MAASFYTRGCTIRLDKLSSVERRSKRTTEDSSSRCIMRLVPVFILETHNQTNNECFPKFDQTDNASSSVKTAYEENPFGEWKILTRPFSKKVYVGR